MVLLLELKCSILEYLQRERVRASVCLERTEEGSVEYREAAARVHEVNNILSVIQRIFEKKEESLGEAQTSSDG